MAIRGGGGRLGDAKGADALASLLKRMTPAPLANSQPQPATSEDLAAALVRRSRIADPKISRPRDPVANTKQKEVIRLPRHVIEQAIRQADIMSELATPSPAPLVLNDFGGAAYRRVSMLRSELERFVADARAPNSVDETTRASVARLVGLGSLAHERIIDPDADGYIGHDFGTSSTKAVVRWPYDRALGAFGVPVPAGWSSGGIPHIWPTVVHLHPATSRFTLLPETQSRALSGFKSALIEGRGHRICAGSQATMADAATAFLAMHLAYVLGTVLDRRTDAKISGVNIGVPVAALADSSTYKAFSTIVRAAILLIPNAASLTLDDVKVALAVDDEGTLPFEIHTELAGAIAGYCAGPRPYLGPHMIVDCGSATLDIASFHLGNGLWPIAIHAAGVDPLGADACDAYQKAGVTEEDCRDAARHHEHRIFVATLEQAPIAFGQDEDRCYRYQVIAIGGGIFGPVHRPLLESMEAAFQRPFHRPNLDPSLLCEPGTHPGRLILADGLARAPVDLRQVAMPSDRPASVAPSRSAFISKDQM